MSCCHVSRIINVLVDKKKYNVDVSQTQQSNSSKRKYFDSVFIWYDAKGKANVWIKQQWKQEKAALSLMDSDLIVS